MISSQKLSGEELAGMELMATIKKNTTSNQRDEIVLRFNVGIARVKKGDIRGDLFLYIKLTIGSLSAAGCYKLYVLGLQGWGSVVDANCIQQQQMPPTLLLHSITENNTPRLQKNPICCSVPKALLKLSK